MSSMAPESRDEGPQGDEVRQRIDSLYDRAENETGNYNATRAMATVSRSRGVPLAKRPSRRPDPALDEVARTWFDGARARFGPSVPAALPADRLPRRPAPSQRGGGLPGDTPKALGAAPSAGRPEALERAVDRVVAELTAGRATDPASLALAARESGRAALPGPRRPELPSAAPELSGASAPELALPPAPAALSGAAPAALTPVEPAGLGPAETAVLPVAAPYTAQGAPLQDPRPLPGATAPGRRSPAASKADNQRKLAAASDVISRYAAQLVMPAAAVQAAPTMAAIPTFDTPAQPTPAAVIPPAVVTTTAPAPTTSLPAAAVTPTQPMPAAAAAPTAAASTPLAPTTPVPAATVVPPMPVAAVAPADVMTMPTTAAVPPPLVAPVAPATVPGAPPVTVPAPTPGLLTTAVPHSSAPVTPNEAVLAAPPASVPSAWDPASGQWQQSQSAVPGAAMAAMPAVDAWSTTTAPAADAGSLGPAPESSQAVRAARAIAFARAQIGKPCVWGATGPDSYDCSSLTQAAWRAAGVTLPRSARQQALAGAPVTLAGIEPGDLVLFFDDDRHVGLHVGGGLMVHAPGPGSSIREESIYGAGESAIHRIVRPA
ncbi:NlpC/P60 family protein [Streptomyces sp. NPDC048191]|uniref:NlpC/P60 family protein n=1 Tax=Streptomyces sp. NPDC048191 TaxID=3155484 RepID=UPI0033CD0B25